VQKLVGTVLLQFVYPVQILALLVQGRTLLLEVLQVLLLTLALQNTTVLVVGRCVLQPILVLALPSSKDLFAIGVPERDVLVVVGTTACLRSSILNSLHNLDIEVGACGIRVYHAQLSVFGALQQLLPLVFARK